MSVVKKERIKIERVPHDKELNYTQKFVETRRKWLEEKTGVTFEHVSCLTTPTEDISGNTENLFGAVQVPVGAMGPLLVKGDYAQGTYYVPFATTEGALIETYQRGAIAITKAGGVNVYMRKDQNHLDPVFIFKNINEARTFVEWIEGNFAKLKEVTEATTTCGKLLHIDPFITGRRVILDCTFYTKDAMGANMINIATEALCKFILSEKKATDYLLRSNYSSEKKGTAINMIHGYGKEVFVDVTIPAKIFKRFLFTTPEILHECWDTLILSSSSIGMCGFNAHLANGLSAMFIACGQDVAHVTNASVGLTSFEVTPEGDFYASLKLPNIIVGTVGGGTALATQRECLEMIGCYGQDKTKKFAEIVGAALLAGEIGICAGLTTEYFLDPHRRARKHTREKAFVQKDN